MEKRNMSIVFSSNISGLTERNSSFDSGVLRVAYTGRNRNNTFISKDTFEQCIGSIYNCPIVCRYDREADEIGSHDMELVHDADGGLRLVNMTQPVGVIPESAKYWFESIEDNSGIHEYLCVDALIWKRQEAYKKIKEDGITDESMEITVFDWEVVDGVHVIKNFEFTAFCLLGTAEPCFESASLEVFSCSDYKEQFAEMMKDLKESFSLLSTPNGDGNRFFTEGGYGLEKNDLLAEYGLSEDQLDFNIEELTYEELEEALKALKFDDEPEDTDDIDSTDDTDSSDDTDVTDDSDDTDSSDDSDDSDTDDDGDDDSARGAGTKPKKSFVLEGQFREELVDALYTETIATSFGEMPRYCFVDYDDELSEVYAYDMEDWKLYGFNYSKNGDTVEIGFESKTRKKFTIVDFDEGEQTQAFAKVFADVSGKYQAASAKISEMESELTDLRQYKADIENANAEAAREEVFEKFEDLVGLEAFETLRTNCADISIEALEEKCYAIRGKYGVAAKFSFNGDKKPKIKVPKEGAAADEPYGGIFAEYGIGQE